MAVDEKFRKLGVGCELCMMVEDWTLSLGITRVVVSTLNQMDKAFNLFMKNGYKFIKNQYKNQYKNTD